MSERLIGFGALIVGVLIARAQWPPPMRCRCPPTSNDRRRD